MEFFWTFEDEEQTFFFEIVSLYEVLAVVIRHYCRPDWPQNDLPTSSL